MDGAATMTMMMEQTINNTREPPEASCWTNIPLHCVPLRVYTICQGQVYLHSCQLLRSMLNSVGNLNCETKMGYK